MHARLTSLLVATLVGASLTACTSEQPPSAATSAPSPARTPSPSPSPSVSPSASPSPTPPVATSAVAVYYVRDTGPTGPRLYREFHARPTTDQPARDAVEAMLEQRPTDRDYTSLWAEGTGVNDVVVDDSDPVIVDLTAAAATPRGGAAAAAATLQQLVHTVTAAEPTARSVQLLIDGEPVPSFWGAIDASRPITRARAAEILGPVWILEPTEGATLAPGDRIGGEASVFEATVNWEWVQGDTVVARGFSTADQGAPGRGAWSAKVDVPRGDYELRAFESSPEDGSPTFVDTKTVTVG